MQSFAPLAATAVSAFAVTWIMLAWARCHHRDLQASSEFLDDYYRAAQRLINDDATPESVIDFIASFSRNAGAPAHARHLALHILGGRLKASRPIASERSRALALDLEAMPKDKQELFAVFVVNGLAASAASDPILSRVYLTVLNVFFSASGRRGDTNISVDRANTAAVDLSGGFNGCAMA